MKNIPEDLFYRGCMLSDWQMTDSERLALRGILDALRPSCSLEIGTYRGGSLSLIRQYSSHTISLDKDPGVRESLPRYANVEFVIGESATKLPDLLNDIYARGLDLEFVLLDGDHSREAVKRDLNILLSRISPQSRTVLLMHDTFNPDCRRGILEADWPRSQHVGFVDLDLVPGRLIETPGAGCGELWGGFGIAIFSAVRNSRSVVVRESSHIAHEMLAGFALTQNEVVAKEVAPPASRKNLLSRAKSKVKRIRRGMIWNRRRG